MTSDHDHSRPNRAAQLATMALVRALVAPGADDRAAIRRAAIAGGCPACNAVAVATWGLGVLAPALTRQPGITPELAAAILAAVEETEAELRSESN